MTKNEQLRNGIKKAMNIIDQGTEIMTVKQLGKWEGCRGYLEYWHEFLKNK